MKDIMFDYRFIFFAFLILLVGCQEPASEEEIEDYEKLFPWQGISLPEQDSNLPKVSICDPRKELIEYVYDINNIKKDTFVYDVHLVCSFVEKDFRGGIKRKGQHINSRLKLRFIDPKIGTYKYIGTSRSDKSLDYVLENNEEFILDFQASSAYPLFISVDGVAPRWTEIEVQISAKSQNGLYDIDPIISEQVQNKEGINRLSYPFCEYIVLP